MESQNKFNCAKINQILFEEILQSLGLTPAKGYLKQKNKNITLKLCKYLINNMLFLIFQIALFHFQN